MGETTGEPGPGTRRISLLALLWVAASPLWGALLGGAYQLLDGDVDYFVPPWAFYGALGLVTGVPAALTVFIMAVCRISRRTCTLAGAGITLLLWAGIATAIFAGGAAVSSLLTTAVAYLFFWWSLRPWKVRTPMPPAATALPLEYRSR